MSEVTTVERSESVPSDKVVAAYITGRRAGKSNGEIAESLGMKKNSFSVRITNLRKKFAADAKAKADKGETVVNPFDNLPARSRGKAGNVFDTNKELLEELAKADTPSAE